MINIIFILIIVLIVIKETYENFKINNNVIKKNEIEQVKTSAIPIPLTPLDRTMELNPNVRENSVVEYDVPKPWSRVVYIADSNYPYHYYIKLKIPSLNDYEAWKTIIPNLNFDPRSGELVIPSKDEASALALANLISINFTGKLSLDNILEKNLIQISIAKAKAHEVVRNKLREQIIENLHGSKFNSPEVSFEKDLVNLNKSDDNMNFSIEAYNGNDYAYL